MRVRAFASRRARGFTLTEIAVAVAVLALLLGGLLVPLATQLEASRQRDTQRLLEAAREALIGFAIANGRLPCPARANVATGLGGAGVEELDLLGAAGARTCVANMIDPSTPQRAVGVLPWVTLGLPEADAWGRRFTYVVLHRFADEGSGGCNPLPGAATFCAPMPTGETPADYLSVRTRLVAGPTATLPFEAQFVVAFLVSHGRNGFFGWQPAGTEAPGPANPNERDEGDHRAVQAVTWVGSPLAIDRVPLRETAGCNDKDGTSPFCEYDDQVMWLSRSLLVGRMAAAGRL